MSILTHSWNDGFARGPDESEAPEQWQGLVGAWAPHLGIQGSVLYDVSGYASHGTLTNMTLNSAWTVAERGQALSFDGVDDHVAIADAPQFDLVAAGTLAAWIKRNSLNAWHSILAKGNVNSNPAHNYAIEINSGNNLVFILGNGVSDNTLTTTTTITTGVWYHVVATWNGSTMLVYLNGQVIGTAGQSLTPAANTSALYIGQFGGNADRFNGLLDDLRIYNHALQGSEVAALYADPGAMFRQRQRRIWAFVEEPSVTASFGTLMLLGAGR